MPLGMLVETVQYLLDPVAGHAFEPGHRLAELLHFLRRQVLHHLRRFLLANRQQEDRAVREARVTHSG